VESYPSWVKQIGQKGLTGDVNLYSRQAYPYMNTCLPGMYYSM